MAEGKTGPSLISRAGKSSSQRFQVLKHEAEVLGTDLPKKFVPPAPILRKVKKDEIAKEALDQLISKELKSIAETRQIDCAKAHTLEKQSKTSPFRASGREHHSLFSRSKSPSPPCGHYNINYSQVDRNQAVPSLNRSRSTPPVDDESPPPGCYEPVPVTRTVPSLVSMRHQLSRKPLPSCPVHEKRFHSLSLIPAISTKSIRTSVPDMTKALPRAGLAVVAMGPSYNANKEVTMRGLGTTVQFAKMRERKPLFEPIPDHLGMYDVQYSQIEPKVSIKNFSKMPPRDRDPSLPLPAFMQNATSRISLEHPSEKTIKMNCTRDSLLSPKLSPAEMLKLLDWTQRSNSVLGFT